MAAAKLSCILLLIIATGKAFYQPNCTWSDDFQYNSQSGGIFKKYLKRVSTPKGTRPFSHFSNICYIVIEIYVTPFTRNLCFYQYDCVTISKMTSRVLSDREYHSQPSFINSYFISFQYLQLFTKMI